MESTNPEHIDSQQVNAQEVSKTKTLGITVDESEMIKRGFERVLDPGYAFCPDDLDQRDRRNVDIIL